MVRHPYSGSSLVRVDPPVRTNVPVGVRLCLLYNRLFAFRLRRDWLMQERIRAESRRKTDPEGESLRYAEFEFSKASSFLAPFGAVCFHGKRIVDFGCRFGGATAWYLSQGAKQVVGVDVRPKVLDTAKTYVRQKIEDQALLSKVEFRLGTADTIPVGEESVDLILSEDVVEHLSNPAAIFEEWWRILAPGGQVLLRFGPLWYHPHGVHLWEVFPGPWSHVIFSERTCVRVRDIVKGYESNSDRWTDMNKMSIRWFKRLVQDSKFRLKLFTVRAAWGLKPLMLVPYLREFFAAGIDCILEKPLVDEPCAVSQE